MANLHLNLNFFKNKKGTRFLAEYLDDQLNAVVNYINLDLIPYIEGVNFAVTSGVVGDRFSVFCNIADNDTGYMYLNDVNFDNNLLSLSKLAISPKGSVLASSIGGNIIPVTPVESNCLLFADLINDISFRKIEAADLDNNIITGDKLQVLNLDNFVPGAFIDIIPDSSIGQNNLQNVSNNKILDGCIDFRNLGVFEGLIIIQATATQLNLDDFEDNCFLPEKFWDESIPWANFIDVKPITIEKLQPMHITDSYLLPYNASTARPVNRTLDGYKASNFSAIINLDGIFVQNVRLTKPKIALGCVSKTHFDQEIQDAIAKYIQIKNGQLNPPVQKTAGELAHAYLDKLWYYDRSIEIYYNEGENINNFIQVDISHSVSSAKFTISGNFRIAGYVDIGHFSFSYSDLSFKSKSNSIDYEDVVGNNYNQERYKVTIKLIYANIYGKDSWKIYVTKTP